MHENSIQYTVLKFENKFAVLHNDLFGEIKWPIKKLPDQIEIGDQINLIASNQEIPEPKTSYHNQDIKNLLQELIEK
jgi:hypothetical protein